MPRQDRERKEAGDMDWIAELYSQEFGSATGFQLGTPTGSAVDETPCVCLQSTCRGCQSAVSLENDQSLLQAFDELPLPTLDELLQLPLSDDPLFREVSTTSAGSTADRLEHGSSSCAAHSDFQAPTLSSSEHFVLVEGNVTPSSSSSFMGIPAYGERDLNSAVQSREASPVTSADRPPKDAEGLETPAISHQSQGSDQGGDQSGHGSDGSDSQHPVSEEDKKKHARMMRNRESAHLSRQRKKMQLDEKDRRCQELQSQNAHLTGVVSHLMSENAALRHHLAAACQKDGQPVPAIMTQPPPLPSMLYPYPYGYSSPTPGQYAYAGGLPKLPIQKLKPTRPAPCELLKVNKDQDCHAKSAESQRHKRRRQTLAGGGTILAALFCFLVFSGPGMPGMSGQKTGTSRGNPFTVAPIHFQALPAAADIGRGRLGAGRVLQSAETETNATGSQGWRTFPLQQNDQATEVLALQHLKDIAPVAIFSEMDGSTGRYSPPSPWTSFTALADSVLSPDGLASPAGCKEVFSFDTSSVQSPHLAHAQLQQYLASLSTFKGRSLKALPLPPIGDGSLHAEEDARPYTKAKTTIGCSDDTDMIISVMLPTKGNVAEPDSLTTLDKLYVVVLRPNKKYTTYSCGLQSPILV